MSEFHDDYPQYELMANHSEEEGKKIRRTLWNVFWIMLAITIAELIIGSMAPGHGWSGTAWLQFLFIGLTVLKAGFIVMAFMHLGHEVKFMKYVVLLPYTVFMLYGIFVILNEGIYSGEPVNKARMDHIIIDQQKALTNHDLHHDGAAATEGHGEEHKEEAHH
jgi:cytochrome c oxidase subunit IV